jgi:hypothetical protein
MYKYSITKLKDRLQWQGKELQLEMIDTHTIDKNKPNGEAILRAF